MVTATMVGYVSDLINQQALNRGVTLDPEAQAHIESLGESYMASHPDIELDEARLRSQIDALFDVLGRRVRFEETPNISVEDLKSTFRILVCHYLWFC
jgi:hypothetical protein